jgi:hypothetical protein
MSEEKAKPSAKPATKNAPREPDEKKPSDAEAPGPITPEHESGSWEQTQEEQEARK